jgi:flavin reductase (DIM6/NTAB) family NADH-FMN oxidoreductase RutF
MTNKLCDAREDVRGFRNALGSFGTGVAVVTATQGGQCLGMTINSFTSVSLQPPLVLWSVGKGAANYTQFLEAERFAIHILGAGQQSVSDRFSQSGGDKFVDVPWEYDQSGVPRLLGCLARFECRREVSYPGGDHQIIIGAVDWFESLAGSPLLFVQGRYLDIGACENG